MRSARYFRKKRFPLIILHGISRLALHHCEYKYGICIPYNTEVGSGLYIGHHGGIVVNHKAIIGNNCNINHGVTIGATFGGKYPGTPIIGNCVYMGPGAKIIGGIAIGDHVAIGANCVVTEPAPNNAVVVGIPGTVISLKGSGEYVINTDYAGHA